MSGIDRREWLRRAAALPLAGAALPLASVEAAQQRVARQRARGQQGPYRPRFFGEHEWTTVRLLGDLVIPRDARSGSASDALVPEFIDTILLDPLAEPRERETMQTRARGGLAWLDRECRGRFGLPFALCAPAQRTAVLDDIAWPEKARPELAAGVAFFSFFRDLVASGFWSSRMGVDDLRYTGNTYVAEWKGCPPEVLARLGLEKGET